MLKLIEFLLAFYCFVGMLTGDPALAYIGLIISLIIQFLAIARLVLKRQSIVPRVPLIIYTINISVIVVIMIFFAYAGYSVENSINRFLVLLSIFGLTIIFCLRGLRLDRIIKVALTMFAALAVVIATDSATYLIQGNSLWPPETYIGYRFSGPFFDPNFLSITYAFMFVIALYGKFLSGTKKLLYLIVFLSAVLLGGSWSALIALVFSILLSKMFRSKNYGKKQIVIILTYLLWVMIAYSSIHLTYPAFETAVAHFDITAAEANAKFASVEYRLDAQSDALHGIIVNPLGYGAQSIVPNIGRDTHNSYIGFSYELGILGILLILLNLTYKQKFYNRANDILTTFFFIIALTINIHYSSIYFMLLILIYNNSQMKPSHLEIRAAEKKSIQATRSQ